MMGDPARDAVHKYIMSMPPSSGNNMIIEE